MRPNTLSSLRWIAAVCLLSGCYRPWMQPGAGYGGPMYGNQYYQGGYGGYQGIQTLTPGQYYAPGVSGTPTYIEGTPNGLQPQADPNSSGGAGSGDGGDAPPSQYNPPANGAPAKPVPNDPYYPEGNGAGGGLQEPETESPDREIDSGNGAPSVMMEPAATTDWANEQPIEQTGLKEEASVVTEPVEDEAPPLLAP